MELIPLLAAAVCGFFSGLGIGGGSLLMVYLTAFAAVEQRTAQAINLLLFLPSAALALLFHSKNRFVDWHSAVWAILGGAAFAALGAYLSSLVETALLRRLFGGFLLAAAASELLYKEP